MWYPILFLIIGVIVIAFGQLIGWKGDRPPGRENMEVIKTGCTITVIGAIIAMISLGVLSTRLADLLR